MRKMKNLSPSRLRAAQHHRAILKEANQKYRAGGDEMITGVNLFDKNWQEIQNSWQWVVDYMDQFPTLAQLCHLFAVSGRHVLATRSSADKLCVWLEYAIKGGKAVRRP